MQKVELTINPALKAKFKQVLEVLDEMKKPNINVGLISERDNIFTIEYESPRDLFNLGRAFEPYKLPEVIGSFTRNFDNNYINNI